MIIIMNVLQKREYEFFDKLHSLRQYSLLFPSDISIFALSLCHCRCLSECQAVMYSTTVFKSQKIYENFFGNQMCEKSFIHSFFPNLHMKFVGRRAQIAKYVYFRKHVYVHWLHKAIDVQFTQFKFIFAHKHCF